MEDFLLPMRTAVLKELKHDAGVLGLIAAASLYPSTVPAIRTFPFGRFGSIIGSPFRASCLDSSAFRFSYQAFTKQLLNEAGTPIRFAEDNAILIGSALKHALDGKTLLLSTGDRLRIEWIQTSPRIDGTEADAWMTTVTFDGEVAG